MSVEAQVFEELQAWESQRRRCLLSWKELVDPMVEAIGNVAMTGKRRNAAIMQLFGERLGADKMYSSSLAGIEAKPSVKRYDDGWTNVLRQVGLQQSELFKDFHAVVEDVIVKRMLTHVVAQYEQRANAEATKVNVALQKVADCHHSCLEAWQCLQTLHAKLKQKEKPVESFWLAECRYRRQADCFCQAQQEANEAASLVVREVQDLEEWRDEMVEKVFRLFGQKLYAVATHLASLAHTSLQLFDRQRMPRSDCDPMHALRVDHGVSGTLSSLRQACSQDALPERTAALVQASLDKYTGNPVRRWEPITLVVSTDGFVHELKKTGEEPVWSSLVADLSINMPTKACLEIAEAAKGWLFKTQHKLTLRGPEQDLANVFVCLRSGEALPAPAPPPRTVSTSSQGYQPPSVPSPSGDRARAISAPNLQRQEVQEVAETSEILDEPQATPAVALPPPPPPPPPPPAPEPFAASPVAQQQKRHHHPTEAPQKKVDDVSREDVFG